jgi:hypothetical protein
MHAGGAGIGPKRATDAGTAPWPVKEAGLRRRNNGRQDRGCSVLGSKQAGGQQALERGAGQGAPLEYVPEAILRASIERDVSIASQVEKDRAAGDQAEADMGLEGRPGIVKRARRRGACAPCLHSSLMPTV